MYKSVLRICKIMRDTRLSCRRPLTLFYDHANERLDFIKEENLRPAYSYQFL